MPTFHLLNSSVDAFHHLHHLALPCHTSLCSSQYFADFLVCETNWSDLGIDTSDMWWTLFTTYQYNLCAFIDEKTREQKRQELIVQITPCIFFDQIRHC
jgi:hypothetical protein